MKRGPLALIMVLFFSACGSALDGRWTIDTEATTESCLLAIEAGTSEKNSDHGSDSRMRQMIEGVIREMCEGVATKLAPQVDIDGSKMSFTTLIGEQSQVKCSINVEINKFDCSEMGGSEVAGAIRVEEGKLIWELPPQPERPSFTLIYTRPVKKG